MKHGSGLAQRMLVLTLIAYVFLALGYNNAARLNYAPDEPWHYLYVRNLADGRGLPTAELTHQAQHPPLYYAVGALWVRLARVAIGSEEPETAVADGMTYTFFRGEEYALRFLSTLFGCAAILAVYTLAARLAPADPWLRVVAPAALAFTPLFTYMTSVVNNDGLLILLVTLLLGQVAAFLQTGEERRLPAAGGILGLALLTKDSALALLALPVAAVVWRAPREGRGRALARGLALVLVPALAIWIWWPARNLVVAGSPFLRTTATESTLPAFLQNPVGVLFAYAQRTLASLLAPEWIVRSFVPLGTCRWVAVAAIVIVIGGLLRGRAQRRGENSWVGAFVHIGFFGLALLLAGILHYVLFVDYTAIVAGRYLLPLSGMFAILVALGTRALLPVRSERAAAAAAVGAWVLLLAGDVWFLALTVRFYVGGYG